MSCRNCNAVRRMKAIESKHFGAIKALEDIDKLYNAGKTEATEGDLRRLILKIRKIKEELSE